MRVLIDIAKNILLVSLLCMRGCLFLKSLHKLRSLFLWLDGLQGLSSLTSNGSYILCRGSSESQPLDCQRIPSFGFFFFFNKH